MLFRILFLLLLATAGNSQVEPGNILLLQKRGKTVAKYYPGTIISFFTTDGMPVFGTVDKITADSIYLTQYNIRRIHRADGALVFDTTSRFRLMFHLNNIGSFPAGKQAGKNILTDGTLLKIGGAGYLILNIFNTTRQGDPPFGEENLPNVLIATGAVAAGYLLGMSWPKRMVLGKKYSLKVLGS